MDATPEEEVEASRELLDRGTHEFWKCAFASAGVVSVALSGET